MPIGNQIFMMKGRIVQIIPPKKQDLYLFNMRRAEKKIVKGKYIIVLEDAEKPAGRIRRRWYQLKNLGKAAYGMIAYGRILLLSE